MSAIISLICFLVFKLFKFSELQKLLFVFGLPTISVGVTQYFTLFRILGSENKIFNFYRNLVSVRIKENSKDIRETYSHLREHSNSSFIVLIEVCVTFFILFLISLIDFEKYNKSEDILIDLLKIVSVVIVWIMPNIFMWSRANQLEKDFLFNSEKYIKNEIKKIYLYKKEK